MSNQPASQLSPAELDREMYSLIADGRADTARYEALQREHDRRDR